MTSTNDIGPGAALLRLALLSVATAIAAAALGAWPTYRLAGGAGLAGLGWGVGIALVAALLGLIPPVLVLRAAPPQRLRGTLAGMLVRFVVMLTLLLAGLLGHVAQRLALALWAVIGYILLLGVDTAGVLWLTKRAARTSA